MERNSRVFIPDGIATLRVGSRASRALRVGVIIGSFIAFGWVVSGAVPSLGSLGHMRWSPLVGAIVLQFGTVFLLMVIWERLLGLLWTPGGNAPRPFRSSLYAAYSRSWLARYIPGRIWSLGSRALLASRLGVPVDVVIRSMAIEVIFTYALVTIIAGALLLGIRFHILGGATLLAVGLGAFTASLLKSQEILNPSLSSVHKNSAWLTIRHRAHKLILGDSHFTLLNIVWGVLVYGFYGCLQMGVIVLMSAGFTDLNASQAAIIAGSWGISLTIGWVSFLAPVGVGVRDGLAFALFAQVLDPSTASLIVIASRVTTLGTDLVFVGAVEALHRVSPVLIPGRRGFAAAYPESAEGPAGHTTPATRK